jgi:hypothetical protein
VTEGVHNPARRFLTALTVGAVVGIVAGFTVRAMRADTEKTERPTEEKTSSESTPAPESAGAKSIEGSAAWQYAVACRDGDWERVLASTLWIRDRLEFVQQTDGAQAIAAERDRLIAELGTRTVADNRLTEEGVEDQYVFSPGAEIEYESVDAGRGGLDAPVARRTWLRVTYPLREKSLLDADGLPIRSLRVGINVSHDGYVLKGNVIGNLDIDWESILYDWPTR